jgi:hypothetical protein
MDVILYRKKHAYIWSLLFSKMETFIIKILGKIFTRRHGYVNSTSRLYIYVGTYDSDVAWAGTSSDGNVLETATLKMYLNIGLIYKRSLHGPCQSNY